MKNDKGFYTWQYDGVAKWVEIYSWCEDHFGPTGWHGEWDCLSFEREEDYTMFMLKWL